MKKFLNRFCYIGIGFDLAALLLTKDPLFLIPMTAFIIAAILNND